MRNGNRVGGAFCITHAVLHVPAHDPDAQGPDAPGANAAEGHEQPARFGFIITKAVGNAVTRNLVRRRLKSIVDHRIAAGFTGADVVFRALPASATAEFSELEREVIRSLERAKRPAPPRRRG